MTLTPDKAQVGPRDTVTYQLQATNYAGEPVQAEFSVGLVDLAALLAPPNSGPIVLMPSMASARWACAPPPA